MGSLHRKLRSAWRLRRTDWRMAAEAAAALVVARGRSLLPFRVMARQLGGIAPPGTAAGDLRPLPPEAQALVRRVRWAVAAVAPLMPFRTLCLQQAIAARAMLARRGIGSVLCLGVADAAGGPLKAHAWLDAGGLKVTGYPVDPALAEVGRFV